MLILFAVTSLIIVEAALRRARTRACYSKADGRDVALWLICGCLLDVGMMLEFGWKSVFALPILLVLVSILVSAMVRLIWWAESQLAG
jgi:hypothetical protein